jgi:hypothetical protein
VECGGVYQGALCLLCIDLTYRLDSTHRFSSVQQDYSELLVQFTLLARNNQFSLLVLLNSTQSTCLTQPLQPTQPNFHSTRLNPTQLLLNSTIPGYLPISLYYTLPYNNHSTQANSIQPRLLFPPSLDSLSSPQHNNVESLTIVINIFNLIINVINLTPTTKSTMRPISRSQQRETAHRPQLARSPTLLARRLHNHRQRRRQRTRITTSHS